MWESYLAKTRILILGRAAGSLFRYIQDFHGKEIDVIESGSSPSSCNDFALLITEESETAASFNPNILLNTLKAEEDMLLNTIVAGGVYIFPETAEKTIDLETSSVYSRRIAYAAGVYTFAAGTTSLETEMGPVPLLISNPELLDHLEGVRLLCQQTGIMEEAFYEALMNYSETALS